LLHIYRFWTDLPQWLKHRRWVVAAAYGLGVVVILLSVESDGEKVG
jgi:hypothetical protein